MFGKDDTAQDQTATADPVQPTSFGQALTMPEPTADNSATDTNDATTSPTIPPDGNLEVNSSETKAEVNDMPATTSTTSNDDLLKIKQSALQNLAPLVGQLDQTPEEKFKTTMMMIQAGDDQSLIQNAYDTANQITDEKVRAQALLDIVNEINYFTQQHNS